MSDLGVSPDLRGPVFKPDLSGGLGKALGDTASTMAKELPGAYARDKEDDRIVRGAAVKAVEESDKARAAREALPKPPVPPPQQPPQYQETSMGDKWGSLAMGMAVLGSAMTRRPAVNSLNAAAGVLNAFHDRDVEAYNRNFQHWKATSEYALKMYEYERDAYRDALADIDKNPAAAMQNVRVLAAAFKHDAVQNAAALGNAAAVVAQLNETAARLPLLQQQTQIAIQEGELSGAALSAVLDASKNPTDLAAAERARTAVKALHDYKTATKGGYSASETQADRANKLYEQFEREFYDDPANAGKQPTAQKRAEWTAQAYGSAKGTASLAGTAPPPRGEEGKFIQDKITQAEAAAKSKGEPFTDTERSKVREEAHRQWALKGAEGHLAAGQQLADQLYDPETRRMIAQSYVAGNDRALVGLARTAVGTYAMAGVWKDIGDLLREQEHEEFVRVYGRDPDTTEQRTLDDDRGRRLALAQAEFQGIRAGERTAFTRAAGLVTAAAEAKQFTPQALEMSAKVSRTKYPNFNSIQMAVQQGTGNEDVVKFHVANVALADAFAQVIGRGNAQLTDAARTQAMSLLETRWSEGQYAGAVEMINREIDAAQKAPEEVIKRFREGFLQRQVAVPVGGVGAVQPPGTRAAPPPGASARSMPLPEAYKSQPDGTEIRQKSTGTIWVKQGDKLVEKK